MQVVFVSPFEHHSNLLPWLEIGSEVRKGNLLFAISNCDAKLIANYFIKIVKENQYKFKYQLYIIFIAFASGGLWRGEFHGDIGFGNP